MRKKTLIRNIFRRYDSGTFGWGVWKDNVPKRYWIDWVKASFLVAETVLVSHMMN